MKLNKFLFVYFFLIFSGCSGPKENSAKGGQDSTNILNAPDSNEYDTDPKEIRKYLIESYSKTISIDTAFSDKKDKYRIVFKHFCTMDSDFKIPSKYNFDTKKDFITSNFKSCIILIKNKDTIVNTIIDKRAFKKLLSPELDSFASLFFPNLKISNDTIEIHYSISIPVTDIGISAVIEFDKKGKYYIKD